MNRLVDEARSFLGIMILPIERVAATIAMPALRTNRCVFIDATDVAGACSAAFDYCHE
ncbi:hypothetical protein [Cupriavidus cauae]|uniref:hypothetical protein n=1 Tax=Cupriavidus cauae TaxID=2608999 RepID=UPI0016804B6E|nr:hypothetical protein [Cupriavidus cauae]